MGTPSDTLYHLDTSDGPVLAWGCQCGEAPEDDMAIVQWDEPIEGMQHSYCHVKCLEQV